MSVPTTVVTGGTRGIGLAACRVLLRQLGASSSARNLVVVGRDEAAGMEAMKALKNEKGGSFENVAISFEPCDVADADELEGALSPYHIDCLVNCAGIAQDSLLLRAKDAHVQSMIQTNLVGTIQASRIAVKSMVKNRVTHGSIVNVGSIIGSQGNVGQSVYSASKSGLLGFTRSLAKEVGPRSIRVNMIEPGYIHTEMTAGMDVDGIIGSKRIPLNRFGEAEDVANLVGFLCNSSLSSYITGQVIGIDGGMTV